MVVCSTGKYAWELNTAYDAIFSSKERPPLSLSTDTHPPTAVAIATAPKYLSIVHCMLNMNRGSYKRAESELPMYSHSNSSTTANVDMLHELLN